eukprot:744091-Pyramimonas_sp.AAC.1
MAVIGGAESTRAHAHIHHLRTRASARTPRQTSTADQHDLISHHEPNQKGGASHSRLVKFLPRGQASPQLELVFGFEGSGT